MPFKGGAVVHKYVFYSPLSENDFQETINKWTNDEPEFAEYFDDRGSNDVSFNIWKIFCSDDKNIIKIAAEETNNKMVYIEHIL